MGDFVASMHYHKNAIAGSILILTALTAGCSRQQPVQAKQDSGPIAIQVAAVAVKQVRRVVESVGTLYPYDETVVSAEIDGRVDKVEVDLGDRVALGQVMVHISDEEQ